MISHHDAAAIVAAVVKRRSHKQWLKAEYEFRCECIAHDYPYPYPRVTDSPRLDKARRARARQKIRQKMDQAIVLKYFPPVSPPSPPPALASTSSAVTDSPRPMTPQLPPADAPIAAGPPCAPRWPPTTAPANPPAVKEQNKPDFDNDDNASKRARHFKHQTAIDLLVTMDPLTNADIWDIAKTRNQSKQWFGAEIIFRDLCVQHEYPYPPPKSAETDASRRRGVRVKMRRQKIDKLLFGNPPKKQPIIVPASSSPALASAPTAAVTDASIATGPYKTAEELKADCHHVQQHHQPLHGTLGARSISRDTAVTDDADENDTARVATQCTTATTTNAFIGVATSLTCDDITDQPITVTEKTPANEARLVRNCPVDENYSTDIYEKSLLMGDLQRTIEAEAKAEEKIKAAAEAEAKAVAEAETNKKELCRIDDVIEKYNMCCVCLDPYVLDADSPSERRLPIKGACGHDLCETCLDAYFAHAQSLSGRKILRYIKCPLCNEKKAFDIQNKVTDRLLRDLLKARAPKTGSSEEDGQVDESSGMDGPRQLSLEVTMLRKKHEEAEKEMTRLMKRNEELEKVASENAQLKRRIEELEACSVGNCGQ